jgi:hypothetical protein
MYNKKCTNNTTPLFFKGFDWRKRKYCSKAIAKIANES